MINMKRILLILTLFISTIVSAQVDKILPERPSSFYAIVDKTGTLSDLQIQHLNEKLTAYKDTTTSEIAVVIVESTEDYSIEDYAIALGRKWGVGGKEFNNGVIMVVAKSDRKMTIQVGYGLEGAVTDLTAKSIIDNDITPEFKKGNYYRGIDNGVDDIIQAATGRYKAPAGYGSKNKGAGSIGGIIFFIILLIIFFAGRGGRNGGMMSRRGYGGFGTGWLLGSMMSGLGRGGGGGYSGGGGSSGGFGGFGGGSFGGGGASGSW